MFEVTIGKKGIERSWQAAFPETTECIHCHGESRIGFTAFEQPSEGSPLQLQNFVCNLHQNEPDGCWLHDCCAVAVYFCKKCLNPTALYNQG